ncbi:Cof-type HAD-IIB family hydrolase [Faecalicoccus acidiformans]|uniref:Cof-type HAD-IIB family hydrolase n=1 Tax=Faecalicoccus acidiformans TaxID=915173 RepID=UPI00235382EF|nr:Cof-type HAD-IIB family hydrolase [Faecalicoccus acidiformans]
MIKAIVMDMDGTLLDPSNKIMPKTKSALIQLQKKGIQLILASGRSYTRLMPYAMELMMDKHRGWLLEVDGVAVYDLSKMERTILRRMTMEEVQMVFSDLVHRNCESMACFDDGVYDFFPDEIRQIKKTIRIKENLPEDFPWTGGPWGWLADMRDGYPNIRYITHVSEISPPINKIQLMQEEQEIQFLYQALTEKFLDFNVFRTAPRQLEILPKGVSKGETLEKIMEREGWTKDEVLAFGDGENDVSLFDVVENSFAMGQAKAYVKERAKYVTASNNQEGIWQALYKLGLLED